MSFIDCVLYTENSRISNVIDRNIWSFHEFRFIVLFSLGSTLFRFTFYTVDSIYWPVLCCVFSRTGLFSFLLLLLVIGVPSEGYFDILVSTIHAYVIYTYLSCSKFGRFTIYVRHCENNDSTYIVDRITQSDRIRFVATCHNERGNRSLQTDRKETDHGQVWKKTIFFL